MAVDAKAVLQQNKLLIGLYVVAIVPIVLWVVLVMNGVEGDMANKTPPSYEKALQQLNQKKSALNGYIARIADMKKKVNAKQPLVNPVYTPKYTAEYQKRNEELKKQFEDMSNLINARDKQLEEWFNDPKIQEQVKAKGEPTSSDFDSVFKQEIARLQRDYADLVFDSSPINKTCFLWQETTTPTNVHPMQKKFWIQERILMALKKAGAEQLLDKIDFTVTSAPTFSDKGPHFMTPIPARMVFKATFRDLPKIVRELLSQDILVPVDQAPH